MIISVELVWMTGIIGGLFFVLNFATCYSMPWASRCENFHKCKGKECDKNKKLCQNHKPLAWLTILTGVLHIVVSVVWYFSL
ncbi:MAG: hypothetical protein KJ906_01305 [Nanoarchaeota archaeon]|nr:hypothetical protein [Nanoarchaeota archaeon]